MIGITERRYIGADEVAKIFGVSAATINRWARTGKLKGARFGHPWSFLPEDVEAFIKQREGTSPQQ